MVYITLFWFQVAANGSRNWFGILFSHADSKKKFCLMLALFEPGNEPVPWLGNLLRLGPLDDLNATSQEPFPVKLLGECFLNIIYYILGGFRSAILYYREHVG